MSGHPSGFDLATALRTCIHCGLCLDACPTYRLTGDEAESPRGRLVLMAELLDAQRASTLPRAEIRREPLDHCLGCRHCEAVCPSGVPYGSLLESTRELTGPPRGPRAAVLGFFLRRILTNPALLTMLVRAAELVRRALPTRWRAGLPRRRRPSLQVEGSRAEARVWIFAGCAQRVLHPDVVPAVQRMALHCEQPTRVLRSPSCCGALDAHLGDMSSARARARRLIEACEDAELLLVPSAGCSAHLRQLGHVFGPDDPWRPRAEDLAARCADALEWIAGREVPWDFRPDPRRVLYHPPCHHSHAQGLRGQAAALLRGVPGLELVEADEPERCCGSAGSYQLLWPEQARSIRSEKLGRIRSQTPELVLSANPGCELFLEEGLGRAGDPPVENVLVYLAGRLAGLEAGRS